MNSLPQFRKDTVKSEFKEAIAIAIGLTFLASLVLPESASAQWGYYGGYPDYGAMGYERGFGDYGFGWPIYEREGKRIIYKYLRTKKIKFRMNSSIEIGGTRIFYLMPDFKLKNDVIIEYWSPEDEQSSEYMKNDFERYRGDINRELIILEAEIARDWTLTKRQKQQIIFDYLDQRGIGYETLEFQNPVPETNGTNKRSVQYMYDAYGRLIIFPREIPNLTSKIRITKPDIFLDKKELYEKYKETGGKVYFIGPKDTEDVVSIKQELDKILEEIKRERILTEKQAREIISEYLESKNIRFEMDKTLRISGIAIMPDFLLENGRAIEYWSKEDRGQRYRERIYEQCRETEKRFYLIKSGDRKEILDKLDDIVTDTSG